MKFIAFRSATLALALMAVATTANAQARLDVLAALGSPGPQNPQAALIQTADGNFYGTTSQGGAFNAGTVFRVTSGGSVTEVYAFTGDVDGGYPTAGVIQGTDGNLYGTTSQGGAFNAGTVFRLEPAGTLAVLYAFSGGADGAYPSGAVMQGIDGNFYGMTSQGGPSNFGTVFQLTPDGTLTTLHTFTGADGAYPYAAVIQEANGDLLGATAQGGDSDAGVLFRLTSTGTLMISHAFTGGVDGGYPYSGVIRGNDGSVYGTTSQGGTTNAGTVFQVAPDGTFTTLYTFSGATDGAYPYAGVIQGTDGNFYGATLEGGDANGGTLFQLTPSGALASLYTFTGGSDGAYPAASLLQGTDGNFYGTTNVGGDLGGGTLFRLGSASLPMVAWNPPAPIAFGTPLSSAQLNATANVPGTFTYAPAAGTVLHAGQQLLTVIFTPADTTTYVPVTRIVTLTVTPLTPALSWNPPPAISYGTPLSATQLNARTRISGTFLYEPGPGAVLPVGTQDLFVTFIPNNAIDYTTATMSVTMDVTVATPVITWMPAAMPSGMALSGMQLNATANTAGTFVYTPAAGTVLGLGEQTLSVTFTPADAADYATASTTATVNVAEPGASGGGNTYPLQFSPASGARGVVVAGYQIVDDPVLGYVVIGNCSYHTVHSGSGRGGGYKTTTTYFNQTCRWDPYGKLLTVTAGAPAAPTPLSVTGTRTIYATNGQGAVTGSDSSVPGGGFIFTSGSHYAWLTPNPYTVLPQALSTFTVTLQSDGNMPLTVASVDASALAGKASVSSTTCTGQIAVGSTCGVTVTYDPTQFRSPTGLAYDTVEVSVATDAGQAHDFVQRYTIVLTAANTQD